ncbi:hypothetical protein CALVIDRAFT_372749 [Calocera viscosa TUFC12733]|uniref:Fungal-type protein kinase domain-containing protein n=1 Tax=Calocera viscosa (strain TUFC12733) TaxID=1330018 RepID=A0A167GTL3_CALVF|nr:hypothetical protein CALVIDRAFT_372749 [Calocera viscosa TUFC12733]
MQLTENAGARCHCSHADLNVRSCWARVERRGSRWQCLTFSWGDRSPVDASWTRRGRVADRVTTACAADSHSPTSTSSSRSSASCSSFTLADILSSLSIAMFTFMPSTPSHIPAPTGPLPRAVLSEPLPTTSSDTPNRPSSATMQKVAQDRMKNLLAAELWGATVEADFFEAGLFMVDEGRLRRTMQDKLWKDPAQRLAKKYANEKSCYNDVAKFMNKVLRVYYRGPGRGKPPLEFSVYDREMEGVGAAKSPLKPDFLGAKSLIPKKEKAKWEIVQVAGDAKDNDAEAVKQVATYLRCCLQTNPASRCARGFTFNQANRTFRFLLANRGGLIGSPPLTLPKDIQKIVAYTAAITSGPSVLYPNDAQWQGDVFVHKGIRYHVKDFLCVRAVIRGRATMVVEIEQHDKAEPEELVQAVAGLRLSPAIISNASPLVASPSHAKVITSTEQSLRPIPAFSGKQNVGGPMDPGEPTPKDPPKDPGTRTPIRELAASC